ncbi:restriction endonuclease subunit S [Microtetraspora glauca]|uniref:Restriction endonuclease subunit S n=1 Tax=Microtetraspora glauca TaxID=1996 RepID=A0ABV3GIC0_MICGL
MSDRTVTFSGLENENLLELGAGRPRSALSDLYPSLPILRVAEVLDGRIESSVQDYAPDAYRMAMGPKVSRPGDVVLTTKGTVGRVTLMPPEGPVFAYSPQLCYFRPTANGPLKPRYLYYWFKSTEFWNQADALKGQTDMADYLSLSDIQSLKIRIPPLDQQAGVIDVLGSLDDKISMNDRLSTTSKELIRSLYAQALLRGTPEELPLFEAVDIAFGAPFASSGFNSAGEGRPLIRIRDLKTFMPQTWTTQRLEGKETVIAPGEVVAGMDAEFRPTYWLGEEGVMNQRVLRARSRVGGGDALAHEALLRPLALVESYKTGTTVAHLNKSDLATLSVIIPQGNEIAAFEAVSQPLHRRIVVCAQESRRLAELRDTLLPKLMSGEVKVRDAVKVVEGVV